MRPFEYAAPKSQQQAVGLLASQWGQTEVLAGGTDLLALMKDDVVSPKRLVNIKGIGGMDAIRFDGGDGLRIGALARLQDVADHADVRRHYPVLAATVDDAASPQIRHMATLGGNLCQRPRCWYFRNGFGLLPKDPSSGKSMVVEGDNRYHAILGNDGPTYFVSPSSIAPVLIVMQAFVRLLGPRGERELPLRKFFITPEADEREHHLLPNEIITEIVVPPPSGEHFGNYEVRQKTRFDWPLATAAVALRMSGGKVQAARVVMGHVAPVPWISLEAQQTLIGREINEQTADAAGQAAVTKAKSLGRNGYKIQLARVAVKRAILAAAKGGAA